MQRGTPTVDTGTPTVDTGTPGPEVGAAEGHSWKLSPTPCPGQPQHGRPPSQGITCDRRTTPAKGSLLRELVMRNQHEIVSPRSTYGHSAKSRTVKPHVTTRLEEQKEADPKARGVASVPETKHGRTEGGGRSDRGGRAGRGNSVAGLAIPSRAQDGPAYLHSTKAVGQAVEACAHLNT